MRLQEENYSPYEAKIHELKEQRRKLEESVREHTQLWLTKQETRVRLTLEYEATNKVVHKLQIENTALHNRKTQLEGEKHASLLLGGLLWLRGDFHLKKKNPSNAGCSGLMDIENRELKQLQKQAKRLTGSLQKLNTQIYERGRERVLLQEREMMMEVDFLGRIKVGPSQTRFYRLKVADGTCSCLFSRQQTIFQSRCEGGRAGGGRPPDEVREDRGGKGESGRLFGGV